MSKDTLEESAGRFMWSDRQIEITESGEPAAETSEEKELKDKATMITKLDLEENPDESES